MNKKMGAQFFWGVVFCIVVFAGAFVAGRESFNAKAAKNVVFRVSSPQKNIKYDLRAALAYLKYRFEENGYTVLGESYAGDMYPRVFDGAGINVYVRGEDALFDMRRNDEAKSIYYVHRFAGMYKEELREYDHYLSSQKKLLLVLQNPEESSFLESGAVPHERLDGTGEYNVLYIYEHYNKAYGSFLQQLDKVKVYAGKEFGRLSEEERKEELAKANLVVYEMTDDDHDDAEYVAYAVYDIMSYGRPVLTNYKKELEERFAGMVSFFYAKEDMAEKTALALNEGQAVLEKKAEKAREILLGEKIKPSFFLK